MSNNIENPLIFTRIELPIDIKRKSSLLTYQLHHQSQLNYLNLTGSLPCIDIKKCNHIIDYMKTNSL